MVMRAVRPCCGLLLGSAVILFYGAVNEGILGIVERAIKIRVGGGSVGLVGHLVFATQAVSAGLGDGVGGGIGS
jgi:hypothetical protein